MGRPERVTLFWPWWRWLQRRRPLVVGGGAERRRPASAAGRRCGGPAASISSRITSVGSGENRT